MSQFCPFAQRVWIALEEKGIPYEYKEVNPYKKEKHFLGMYNLKCGRYHELTYTVQKSIQRGSSPPLSIMARPSKSLL